MKKKNPYRQSSWHGKPYFFFGEYLREKYSCRILKLPIDASLTCPNRDGAIGRGGCVFCGEDGSASPTALVSDSIREQMIFARQNYRRSDENTRYIAYLQAFTNTYADISRLKAIYDASISDDDIIGLMIGTRPDCVPDEVLDLIASYKKENFELWLELGMQTMHDRSLAYLNRGHSNEATLSAIKRATERGIKTLVHVIIGIPGETWEDIMETAAKISELPVAGVKIHHLHVIKGTKLEEFFLKEKFPMLSLQQYSSVVCDFIERLRPDIMIHRLLGDRNEKSLVAPLWGLHKGTVIKSIEDEFMRRGTFQGFLYGGMI